MLTTVSVVEDGADEPLDVRGLLDVGVAEAVGAVLVGSTRLVTGAVVASSVRPTPVTVEPTTLVTLPSGVPLPTSSTVSPSFFVVSETRLLLRVVVVGVEVVLFDVLVGLAALAGAAPAGAAPAVVAVTGAAATARLTTSEANAVGNATGSHDVGAAVPGSSADAGASAATPSGAP